MLAPRDIRTVQSASHGEINYLPGSRRGSCLGLMGRRSRSSNSSASQPCHHRRSDRRQDGALTPHPVAAIHINPGPLALDQGCSYSVPNPCLQSSAGA